MQSDDTTYLAFQIEALLRVSNMNQYANLTFPDDFRHILGMCSTALK
jgi:hypothetical protein